MTEGWVVLSVLLLCLVRSSKGYRLCTMMQRAVISLCLALAVGQVFASLDGTMRAARIHSAITKEDTSGVYVDAIPMPTPGQGEASERT